MRDAWFCYEMTFDGSFVPVIYYDEYPKKSAGGKENTPDRLQIIKIPYNSAQPDGEYSLSQLQKLYPNPKGLQKRELSLIDNRQEKQMARMVTGYMSSQGQFFDTAAQADLYDASYELTQAVTAAVVRQFGDEKSQEEVNGYADGIRSFITENEKIIREYLDARAAVQGSNRVDNEVGGPTAGDNPPDDTPLRGEPDIPVENPPPTEAVPEGTGEEPSPKRKVSRL